jgi:hypothetical protein
VVVALVGRRLWLRRVRRLLVTLTGRVESLDLAVRSLTGVLDRLSEAGDDEWEAFVDDGESDERRALGELGHRMDVLGHELAVMPLPRFLHPMADDMQAVAEKMRDLAATIDGGDPEVIIDALAEIDLRELSNRVSSLVDQLTEHKQALKVTDEAVYGGGLYI